MGSQDPMGGKRFLVLPVAPALVQVPVSLRGGVGAVGNGGGAGG